MQWFCKIRCENIAKQVTSSKEHYFSICSIVKYTLTVAHLDECPLFSGFQDDSVISTTHLRDQQIDQQHIREGEEDYEYDDSEHLVRAVEVIEVEVTERGLEQCDEGNTSTTVVVNIVEQRAKAYSEPIA